MRSVLVTINGRVQGVWFRDWTKKKADALGLRGWVRNRLDGCVEAQFSGPSDNIDEIIEKCGQGPMLASVDEVIVRELALGTREDLQAFEIRHNRLDQTFPLPDFSFLF